ncbi:MAG: hypothetical protein B5M48_00695 [Candidatus Omnitrophica bacterium 4484_213]|nr:MAG: hypothetical protein B5M48_00695 [Candidatus Omnitrophica bacterium 4484_213]
MQGFITLRRIQEDVSQGRMPADKLLDGVLIFCSGILLLTPGFITDIIGLIGSVPLTRGSLKHWIRQKIEDMINRGEVIRI